MPVVSIYRFEYEILPNMNPWSVFIAAFNPGEAQNHLMKTLGKPIRITSSTLVSRLDDVSGEVRQNIINAFLNTKGNQESKPVAEAKPKQKG